MSKRSWFNQSHLEMYIYYEIVSNVSDINWFVLLALLMWGIIVKWFFKGVLNVSKWDDQCRVHLSLSHTFLATLATVSSL